MTGSCYLAVTKQTRQMGKKGMFMVLAAAAAACIAACNSPERNSGMAGNDRMITDALEQVSADSIYSYIDRLVSFHTRHTLSSKTDPERGIGATVEYIRRQTQEWADASVGRPKPIIEPVLYRVGGPGTRYDRIADVPQIMVTYPGTEGAREIAVMAMIDSRVNDLSDSTSFAPGADDNGSGTALLLEICRIISQMPLRQTVRCLFVSGEEQGLDGSAFYARMAKEEGWPLVAVINDDMIGNVRSSETGLFTDSRVRVFSDSRSGEDSDNRQLARYIKEIGGRYVPGHEVVLNYRNDRYMRGGDQESFIAQGFTAVRMSEYYENYDRTHQIVREEDGVSYGDIIENVSIPYVEANTKVNLATVISLAQAPARPEGARIANARELSNYTVLSWRPVADAASYEILYRETDQPVWQILGTVGASEALAEDGLATASYPLSKDNFFYAVRSVSAEGHPSLPAFCR